MSPIEQRLVAHVNAFVADICAIYRQSALESVESALGASRTAVMRPLPVRASTPPKVTIATAPSGKRTPDEIAATTAKVLAYIRKNPDVKPEVLRADMKLTRAVVKDAIDRLKTAKAIRMKGVKRAATYHAA